MTQPTFLLANSSACNSESQVQTWGESCQRFLLESVAGGEQICQHHCPVAHVAEQFPQLCEAETAAFGRLLGTHVQRLATIAHGDGVCTTFIPATSVTTLQTPDSSNERLSHR